MPFNGSGTFSRLYSWVVDAANDVNISSTRMDAELNGMAAALTNCVTRDGQSPPSADLPMGGKKLTNLGNAAADTDALNRTTGDTRYLLASITSLTLSGALTAGSITTSGAVNFSGTTNVGTLNASNDVTLNSAALIIASNNRKLSFADLNGGAPYLVCGSDNKLALYGTDGSAAARLLFSVLCHSGSSTLDFAVSITAPTQTTADNSTLVATTAFVQANIAALSATYQPLTPRVQTVTSAATVTPTWTNDLVAITAQAVGLTLANPSGSPSGGQGIVIRIKDNGSPQTIAYGTQYRAVGVTLPTTTVASKNLYLGVIWNATDSNVDVVSVAQE